jgi:hypothetical protein
MFDPGANFDKQRRPDYLRTDPPTRVRCAMTRTDPSFCQPQRNRAGISLSADNRHESRCAAERSEAMKEKDRISERQYQDRLESFLKNALNMQLPR